MSRQHEKSGGFDDIAVIIACVMLFLAAVGGFVGYRLHMTNRIRQELRRAEIAEREASLRAEAVALEREMTEAAEPAAETDVESSAETTGAPQIASPAEE